MTDSEHSDWNGPSKSAKKRAAKAVEDIAAQLIELPEAMWTKVPTTSELREEIKQARRTEGHGARKRQMKYLAGLLRREQEETEALQGWLEGIHQAQLQEKRDFHVLEQLRDRICDAEQSTAALDEAAAEFPALDRTALAKLARSVHATGDRKAFREIFRRLRDAWQATDRP